MKLKLVVALILSLALSSMASMAASLQPVTKLQHLSMAKGLSQSVVTAITQDNQGMMWFATLDGLNRFDGNEFKVFRHEEGNPNSLSSNTIHDLVYVAKQNALYIATQTAISRYDITSQQFSTIDIPSGLTTNHLTLYKNHIWLSNTQGLFSLNIHSGVIEQLSAGEAIKKSLPGKTLNLALTASGQVKSNQPGGNEQWTPLTDGNLNVIDIDRAINEWFLLTANQVFSLSRSGELTEILTGEQFEKLDYNERESTLRVVSETGIIAVDTSEHPYKIRQFHTEDNNKPIISLFTDSGNNFWFGTNGNGLFRKSNQQKVVEKFANDNGNDVWGAHQFGQELVVLEDDPEVHFYNEQFEQTRSLNTAIAGPKTVATFGDKLLISGRQTLVIVDANFNTTTLKHDATFSCIIPDIYQGKVYLGTVDHGLMMLNLNSPSPAIVPAPLDEQFKHPILNGAVTKSSLVIGTQNGVIQLVKLDDELIRNGEFLKGRIISGTKIANGQIYAQALDTGMFEINSSGHIEQFSKLNKSVAYSFEVTPERIISATSGGLVVVDRSSGDTVNIYDTKLGALSEFNGMASGKFNDKLVFGGSGGLNLVSDIDKTQQRATAPVITSFRIFNREVPVSEKLSKNILVAKSITLKSSDYPFSFGFSSPTEALDYNISYLYRLHGLDDNWLETANNSRIATYTNVPYGEYRFEIKSTNGLGHDSPVRSLEVTILPPWWLSTSAKAIYAMVLMAIIYLAFRSIQQRRRVQARIAQSEERLKLSLWGSGDEMWDWDIDSGRIYRSNIWGTLDFPQDGQRSTPTDNGNIHPNDRERVRAALEAHFRGDIDHFEATYRVRDKQHNWIWILDRAKIVERDGDDQPSRMTGTIKDISKIKEAEERLTIFARALTNISEGMFILDANFNYLELNDSGCQILGHKRQALIGTPLSLGDLDTDYFQEISNIVKIQGNWASELEHRRPDGRKIHLDVVIDLIKAEDNHPSYFVGILTDITHRKQNEVELRRLTNNDVLTGLPNRTYLHISLDARIKRQSEHCLFVFDLDNFKRINETLGHDVGDSLLCHVANRLNSKLPNDCELYRLGGDEFAVIADSTSSVKNASKIAKRILTTFEQPYLVDEEEIVVKASIGIVSYPEDDVEPHALLRKADLAMYHAKSQGGQRFQFFNDFMNQDAIKRFEVESMIRQALKEHWFELHYQPKMALGSDSIFGMEALVRLNHPSKGLLFPDQFIDLAEETGLIIDIDNWVLKQACLTAEQWRKKGLLRGRMAVNLSSQQFSSPGLCKRIQAILDETGLPAHNLELEITEGTVIERPEAAIQIMKDLNRMQIHLALDDFGTGYSSLSYLKRFPIHTLKIDKSFIDDIATSDRDMKMVDSIITIAHNMNLQVVAEGIEEQSQLTVLKALKCELIQGYHFSKPLKESHIEQKLKNEKSKISLKS
ncbi:MULTISPECIES: EAL domain-containing protein [Ferrimonas]|uniref:EAL domain-containing protein n=1 Tax=Ferrimonas TaxID=44011 RepID=UPI000552CDB5|nr:MULTISPECIES: EAL domain-containing protein [Ferrimonas]USD36674.1 EAL domain-containing protein [Ferrimonas sp. SCSIO 43195]